MGHIPRHRLLKSYWCGIWLECRPGLENWLRCGYRFGIEEMITLLRYVTRSISRDVPRNYHGIIALVLPRPAHLRLFESGRNHGDLDCVLHLLVQNRAENNVGVFVSCALNNRAR